MNKTCACVSRFIVVYFLLAGQLMAQEDWAGAPANLTIEEFLNLYFHSHMGQQEDPIALNSYCLVSFYPSKSPATAFVMIIQTWRDSGLEARDLRREIRNLGDSMFQQFKSMRELPTLRKRWPPGQSVEAQLIIKHVRNSDLKEVLGITVDGITSFDEEAIKKAEASVRKRRGVWGF